VHRDNARRTRKRKKLYVGFLNSAIESLDTALNNEEKEELDVEDKLAERDLTKRERGPEKEKEGIMATGGGSASDGGNEMLTGSVTSVDEDGSALKTM
jgi:hypothetical protein